METTCYRWMPFRLTEYHSPSFEDIVAFSGFDKKTISQIKFYFLETDRGKATTS